MSPILSAVNSTKRLKTTVREQPGQSELPARFMAIEKEIREQVPALSEGQIVEKRMMQALPILTHLHE